MINEPSVDLLISKLGQNGEDASRYELCVVVAKRARQIIDSSTLNSPKENPEHLKEITLACTEIAMGKIVAVKD